MAESDDKRERPASKQIHAAVDRIEDNDVAVLLVGDDEKTEINLPLSLLPEGTSDGDHLRLNISLDKESREAAVSRVKKLQEKLTQQSGTEEQKDFKL